MSPVGTPDIVTYRLNGKMVYVSPAKNYEASLSDHIQD
jgi:hypothetical protein